MPSFDFPGIDPQSPETVRAALLKADLMHERDRLASVGVAGDGNMNCVLRAVIQKSDDLSSVSVIVKQSRPWVAKYPSIDAPAERILAEHEFLKLVASHEQMRGTVPEIKGFLPDEFLLVLEDRGDCHDMTSCYVSDHSSHLPIDDLVGWLTRLHSIPADRDDIQVKALRQLNAEHMFQVPFSVPSAIDLDAICGGLQEAGQRICSRDNVAGSVAALSERYLNPPGDRLSLLHGDFYPGSWLRTDQGLCVIDAEFCYFGEPEFDVAVMIAHLILAGAELSAVTEVTSQYEHQANGRLNAELIRGWAAVEIIRRILGVAQLPLGPGLENRLRALNIAEQLLAHTIA